MNFVNFQSQSQHKTFTRPKSALRQTAGEQCKDAWPHCSGELSKTERAALARNNKPSIIVGDIVRSVIFSIGTVIGLIALLEVFSSR